jgi:hypothetical protein
MNQVICRQALFIFACRPFVRRLRADRRFDDRRIREFFYAPVGRSTMVLTNDALQKGQVM